MTAAAKSHFNVPLRKTEKKKTETREQEIDPPRNEGKGKTIVSGMVNVSLLVCKKKKEMKKKERSIRPWKKREASRPAHLNFVRP